MAPETTRTDQEEEDQEKSPGIGELLKAAREEKGLTLDQMAGVTKLRRFLLEAIENENWEVFPAPVFTKGFIRSYARAVDLDEKDILARYERIKVPTDTQPRPLSAPSRSRLTPIIVLILILIAIAAIIFLWRGSKTRNSKPEPAPENRMEEGPNLSWPAKPSGEEITTEMASIQELGTDEGAEAVRETPGREEKAENRKHEVAVPEAAAEAAAEAAPKAAPKAAAEAKPEAQPEAVAVPPEPKSEKLVLKARILEKTWLRITIDEQDPKEYIFRPGNRPQWEAENGFVLLVGNATGVEFEFNSRPYKNLGRRGQVIRLRFPAEFSANILEE